MSNGPCAGAFRLLSAAILLGSLLTVPAAAATLTWSALPDRERITIAMSPSEGMAGPVGRIDLKALLIPYSQVPPGLEVETPPEGARIFQGTSQYGRALAVMTQTPEFGFMVTRQTPTELVIDFFRNPLGARWKPSSEAPVTELPPDVGLLPFEPGNPVDAALKEDPAGTRLVPQAPEAQVTPEPPARMVPARQAVQPEAAPPAILPDPVPDPPPVIPADPPPPSALDNPEPPAPPTAPAAVPERTQPAVAPPSRPFLDTRVETSSRNAPLPVPLPPGTSGSREPAPQPASSRAIPPPPPVPVSGPVVSGELGRLTVPPASVTDIRPPVASDSTLAALTAAATPQPAVAAPAAVPSAPSGQAEAASQGPVAQGRANLSPGEAPVPSATPQAAQQSAAPAPAPSAQAPSAPVPGMAVRQQGGVAYSGAVNFGPLSAIPGVGGAPAGPAASAPPAAAPQAQGQAPTQTPPAPQPAGSQPGASQAPPAASQDPDAPAEPQVIYVDEQGNPVEPPPDPLTRLPEIRAMISRNEWQPALDATNDLLIRGELNREQREEALHTRAEMLFTVNKEGLEPHFKEIADATTQAINFNQRSPRNAGALLRLGYLNLKVKNIPEAQARFNMLRSQFPDDDNVPLTYYYWGEYYFGRNEYQKAADEFQYVLQRYPNSRYAREASLGLARTFYRMDYFQESFNVVDYIERRWPRFYIEYPPFLNMMGDVAFRLNNLDYALSHYWLYVNLEPNGDEADIILTRIGDIYGLKRERASADAIYKESARRFPDKDGGLVAKMRLAEEGINDTPTVAAMFSVFDRPYSVQPKEIYESIIKDHPASELAPLAKLKLAMWYLWNKNYLKTLDTCTEFLKQFPESPLAPRARDVAVQTFAILSTQSAMEGRYERMRGIWDQYPVVREQEAVLPPESRIAMAVSYKDAGNPNEALAMLDPFFLGEKLPEYSETALKLVLSIYLEFDQWDSILQVGRRVDLWEITPQTQQLLDYATALARENLGQSEEAAPVWQKLHDSGKLTAREQAYAAFFLARSAERNRDLEKAYILGNEALSRLMEQAQKSPDTADVGKIKSQIGSLMDVAESAGRLREALGFADRFMQYLPENDPARAAIMYRKALIYRKQGNTDAWKKGLEEIIKVYPDSIYGSTARSELKSAALVEDAAKYSPTGKL